MPRFSPLFYITIQSNQNKFMTLISFVNSLSTAIFHVQQNKTTTSDSSTHDIYLRGWNYPYTCPPVVLWMDGLNQLCSFATPWTFQYLKCSSFWAPWIKDLATLVSGTRLSFTYLENRYTYWCRNHGEGSMDGHRTEWKERLTPHTQQFPCFCIVAICH